MSKGQKLKTWKRGMSAKDKELMKGFETLGLSILVFQKSQRKSGQM